MNTVMWLGVIAPATGSTVAYSDGTSGPDATGLTLLAGKCLTLKHGGVLEFATCTQSNNILCEAPCPTGTSRMIP